MTFYDHFLDFQVRVGISEYQHDFSDCALTNDDAGDGHVLGGHLQPTSGSRTQIDEDPRTLQELILSVQLQQFEGRTGAVT